MRMASPVLPNSSNFLGVALVINRSRDGPRFVFHYPPHVLPVNSRIRCNGDSIDDLDDDESTLDHLRRRSLGETNGSLHMTADLQQWNYDDHLETDIGAQIVPWEHVAGFPTKDLENILTPARAYHKRLFQVSLDTLYCLSYPVYVPENGIWKKKKKKKVAKAQSSKAADAEEPARKDAENNVATGLSNTETRDMADPPPSSAIDEAEEKKSGMTMFNLVFILNPKKHESQELAETLYMHIIRKVNKAYKYSQQRSDFVWKESKRILALKDKGREDRTKMSALWKDILDISSLAASMQDIYDAVSQNKIAAFQLETPGGTVAHSVQIPVPFYVADTNPEDDETTQGLWITTANSFLNEDSFDEPGFLDKNFALLLMNDEKKIISELQADPDETTAAMVEFVRLSKPTSSFYQVGQGNILSPAQVRKYAQHFIFWRRAIAIPPLHQRDVYILSPNCDTSKLPKASLSWMKAFPLAPPLASFLAELSNAPRPYKWFSPSKAHRPTYLQMLAWLMRGGWVTQLCTFAYVIVWPEILYEVEYENEAEELRLAESLQTRGTESVSSLASSDEHSSSPEATSRPTLGEQVAEKARLERIADKAQREAAEKIAAHGRKQIPVPTARPSANNAAHLSKLVPYIIVDAKKATGKDSQYLSAIGKRFRDPKVIEAWPTFWKYFNGRSALERIALQEDKKRKETWNLLTAMNEYLLCVRHW